MGQVVAWPISMQEWPQPDAAWRTALKEKKMRGLKGWDFVMGSAVSRMRRLSIMLSIPALPIFAIPPATASSTALVPSVHQFVVIDPQSGKVIYRGPQPPPASRYVVLNAVNGAVEAQWGPVSQAPANTLFPSPG